MFQKLGGNLPGTPPIGTEHSKQGTGTESGSDETEANHKIRKLRIFRKSQCVRLFGKPHLLDVSERRHASEHCDFIYSTGHLRGMLQGQAVHTHCNQHELAVGKQLRGLGAMRGSKKKTKLMNSGNLEKGIFVRALYGT